MELSGSALTYRETPLVLDLVKVFGDSCHGLSSCDDTDVLYLFHCFSNPHGPFAVANVE